MPAEVVAAKGKTATGKRTVGLESQARTWATPMSTDGYKPSAGKRRNSDLSHQVQETLKRGGKSSKSTPRLNPLFVEWLMGWPIGWTDCDAVATESFRSWRRTHSAALLRVLQAEVERQLT